MEQKTYIWLLYLNILWQFQILDEICRILSYVKNTQNLARAYKVTDELFDLSTMAMEYFKEAVEPGLPEISYFSSELQASLDALTSKT